MEKHIKNFAIDLLINHNERITNEFNVQFYLGKYLLGIDSDYKIEMEHSTVDNRNKHVENSKKVLDIFVTNCEERYGIEIKCPLQKHQETLEYMKGIIKDIIYLEDLKRRGVIDLGYSFVITNNSNFWKNSNDNIYCDLNNRPYYKCFRSARGNRVMLEQDFNGVQNSYSAFWLPKNTCHRFFVIEI